MAGYRLRCCAGGGGGKTKLEWLKGRRNAPATLRGEVRRGGRGRKWWRSEEKEENHGERRNFSTGGAARRALLGCIRSKKSAERLAKGVRQLGLMYLRRPGAARSAEWRRESRRRGTRGKHADQQPTPSSSLSPSSSDDRPSPAKGSSEQDDASQEPSFGLSRGLLQNPSRLQSTSTEQSCPKSRDPRIEETSEPTRRSRR